MTQEGSIAWRENTSGSLIYKTSGGHVNMLYLASASIKSRSVGGEVPGTDDDVILEISHIHG